MNTHIAANTLSVNAQGHFEWPAPAWGEKADEALMSWCLDTWAKPAKMIELGGSTQGGDGPPKKASRSIKLPSAGSDWIKNAALYGALYGLNAHVISPSAGWASSLGAAFAMAGVLRLSFAAAGPSAKGLATHLSQDKAPALRAFSNAAKALALRLRGSIMTDGEVAWPSAIAVWATLDKVGDTLKNKGASAAITSRMDAAVASMRRLVDRSEDLKARQTQWKVGLLVRANVLDGPSAMMKSAYEDFSKLAVVARRGQMLEAITTLPLPLVAAIQERKWIDKRKWGAIFAISDPSAKVLSSDVKMRGELCGMVDTEVSFNTAFGTPLASYKPHPGMPTLAELVSFVNDFKQARYNFEGEQEQHMNCLALAARAESESIQTAVGEAARATPTASPRRPRL